MTAARCPVCHHRHPTTDICPACRGEGRTNLNRLPGLLIDLTYQLAARPTPHAGPVGRGGVGSRIVGNAYALSLLATTPTALVNARTNPAPPDGATAIPLWVTAWHALWTHRLFNHEPAAAARTDPRWSGLRWDLPAPQTPSSWHGQQVAVRPAVEDDIDALAIDWTLRFGTPSPLGRLVYDALGGLLQWLPDAWAWQDTPEFLTQLARLVSEAAALTGEPTGVVYLGNCPEPVADRVTGDQLMLLLPEHPEPGEVQVPVPQWCGAPIYYRPDGTMTVKCPSCHTVTGQAGWYRLAVRMRDVWGRTADRAAWTAA
jgi:hypothetical protein